MSKIKPDSQEALLQQLKNPFDPRLVKWRSGGGGKMLAYIDARDVMKRLDDVMGVGGWQDKYIAVDGGFICELSLKLGEDWVTKSNGANNPKVEAIKGGISSALKRAAVEWGIGRYLYYLDPNKFNSDNVSNWPKWALPNNDIEKWEDIAEMEAGIDTGMDELEVEYIAGVALEHGGKIHEAATLEQLNEAWDSLSEEEQGILAKEYSKKLAELNAAN